MPYHHYGKLDPKDIEAVIAYLRTLPSIESTPDESKPDFPMNFILNTIPTEANLSQKPEVAVTASYGKYVIEASGCYDCHTKQEKGKFIGEDYAGGMVFNLPGGAVLTSPNITPDKLTGLGNWTEKQFVERFKRYADSSYTPPTVGQGEFQTVMPWTMYATMDTKDLKAIYTYLKSIAAIENKTETFVFALK